MAEEPTPPQWYHKRSFFEELLGSMDRDTLKRLGTKRLRTLIEQKGYKPHPRDAKQFIELARKMNLVPLELIRQADRKPTPLMPSTREGFRPRTLNTSIRQSRRSKKSGR